jgi:hypothetical protein
MLSNRRLRRPRNFSRSIVELPKTSRTLQDLSAPENADNAQAFEMDGLFGQAFVADVYDRPIGELLTIDLNHVSRTTLTSRAHFSGLNEGLEADANTSESLQLGQEVDVKGLRQHCTPASLQFLLGRSKAEPESQHWQYGLASSCIHSGRRRRPKTDADADGARTSASQRFYSNAVVRWSLWRPRAYADTNTTL